MRLQPIFYACVLVGLAFAMGLISSSHAQPPMQAASQMVRSEEALNAGRYAEAITRLDALIASGDLDRQGLALAFLNRGIARQKTGDGKRAKSDYDAALKRGADLPSTALVKAYYNRGILLVAAGDPAAATRDYDAALRLDSAYAAAYHNRANIARKAGSHADAVRDYSAALANMQGEGRKYTLLGRALSLQKLGNVEAARADLQLALSIDPKLHTAREALNELSPGMATDVAAREVDNNNIVTTSLGPTAAATSGEQYISIGSSGGWETVAIRYSTSDLPPQVKYASAAPVELRKQVVMPPVVAVVAATPPKITSTIGRYRVQLASLRSEEIAEDTWSKLQTRADALRALPHNIQQADLGERGIYFRLQVGAFNSAAEAKALCLNLSATNIDCIVVR